MWEDVEQLQMSLNRAQPLHLLSTVETWRRTDTNSQETKREAEEEKEEEEERLNPLEDQDPDPNIWSEAPTGRGERERFWDCLEK